MWELRWQVCAWLDRYKVGSHYGWYSAALLPMRWPPAFLVYNCSAPLANWLVPLQWLDNATPKPVESRGDFKKGRTLKTFHYHGAALLVCGDVCPSIGQAWPLGYPPKRVPVVGRTVLLTSKLCCWICSDGKRLPKVRWPHPARGPQCVRTPRERWSASLFYSAWRLQVLGTPKRGVAHCHPVSLTNTAKDRGDS
jgi:hypothetical protein